MQAIKVVASTIISSLQSPSDMYMQITGKLCDTTFNANQVRVTEAFIDEIVANKEKYVTIPLCADIRGLINDRTIGHLYDETNDEFRSQIIGGLYDFTKEGSGDESSLIITSRVMKRYGAVCNALSRLFVERRLKFSFEIVAGEYVQEEDGSITIDASPLNFLEGVAVVTFPACEDAIARELVAECLTKGDEHEMNQNDKPVEGAVVAEVDKDKAVVAEEQNGCDDKLACKDKLGENEQTAAAEASAVQNAEVPATQNAEAAAVQNAEAAVTETAANAAAQNAEAATVQTAEQDDDRNDGDDHEDEPKDECASKKECASEEGHVPDTAKLIAELKSSIEAVASELASLKESLAHTQTAESNGSAEEPKTVVAENKNENEQKSKWTLLNPFVDSLTLNAEKKWTLL